MQKKQKIIGILALQGGVKEHEEMIEKSGGFPKKIRTPEDLCGISGIIFPGGESTAIGKMILKNHLFLPLRENIQRGLPVWGTCAGAILLGKEGSEFSLKVADFGVRRNGFGRQIASFETKIAISGISPNFPAIFIRAPRFENINESTVEILAEWQEEAVFLRQKHIWTSSFHPELSNNNAVHTHFVQFCELQNFLTS